MLVHDEHTPGFLAQEVDHLAIGAFVLVDGRHLKNKRAFWGILGNLDNVAAAGENRTVVIEVQDADVQSGGAAQGRSAQVLSLHSEGVAGFLLSVQSPGGGQ